MKWLLLLAATCSLAWAQQPADKAISEKEELSRAVADGNKNPRELLLVIEKHLTRHPDSEYRPELEHAAVEAAISLHDDALVVRYGEMALARKSDEVPILAAVTHSLLALKSKDNAERALKYARHTEELVRQFQKGANPGDVSPSEWRNQTDRALARALTDDARATGILGRPEEALATAQRAFETYPNADSAREIALWFERLGKPGEAVRAMADAFTIQQAADTELAGDRTRMGELERKATGGESGLGPLLLEAYDRNAALFHARELRLHGNEPNFGKASPMEFTLTSLDGKKFEMASLKGKVLVLDFWATWCVPCREQHPLYEQVKERFRDNRVVTFLSINADADHTPVKSFVAALEWQGPMYYEDGLARVFDADQLPLTILIDRRGALFTSLKGYVKQTFVDLLTERIRDALTVPVN